MYVFCLEGEDFSEENEPGPSTYLFIFLRVSSPQNENSVSNYSPSCFSNPQDFHSSSEHKLRYF